MVTLNCFGFLWLFINTNWTFIYMAQNYFLSCIFRSSSFLLLCVLTIPPPLRIQMRNAWSKLHKRQWSLALKICTCWICNFVEGDNLHSVSSLLEANGLLRWTRGKFIWAFTWKLLVVAMLPFACSWQEKQKMCDKHGRTKEFIELGCSNWFERTKVRTVQFLQENLNLR